jgi:hypothetical protein
MDTNNIYVHPYIDSEDDCIVLYRVKFVNNLTPIVSHVGNINLKQRFFIKGDKSLQKVQSYDGTNLTLSENTKCYPIDNFLKESNTYFPLLYDILSLIPMNVDGPYRFAAKMHAPKIIFF